MNFLQETRGTDLLRTDFAGDELCRGRTPAYYMPGHA